MGLSAFDKYSTEMCVERIRAKTVFLAVINIFYICGLQISLGPGTENFSFLEKF